ncbi:hypothetical protein [Litoreibacter albidus]|uniref:hypothetical protein n=1 Tax=Litoreibacter albidus TaxID=670155 RepID=UPI003736B632
MKQKAYVQVVYNEAHSDMPDLPPYAVGWDGITIASSAVGGFIGEALCSPTQRVHTEKLFDLARSSSGRVVDIFSGNGPVANSDGRVLFLEHDYFPDVKVLLQADEFYRFSSWAKQIEALGFPNEKADFPMLEFEYIADGPSSEHDFLVALAGSHT